MPSLKIVDGWLSQDAMYVIDIMGRRLGDDRVISSVEQIECGNSRQFVLHFGEKKNSVLDYIFEILEKQGTCPLMVARYYDSKSDKFIDLNWNLTLHKPVIVMNPATTIEVTPFEDTSEDTTFEATKVEVTTFEATKRLKPHITMRDIEAANSEQTVLNERNFRLSCACAAFGFVLFLMVMICIRLANQ